ncbi:hypothetical protein [Phaffia rhodozyma]|uniref:Uncharacterized protein n=1 Tax=Phaffia rhodozyma TaxID=264483 RepID=A0A0F7SWY5_PHARH|nr:hypothetical protein [Phaffia rhodozyma]
MTQKKNKKSGKQPGASPSTSKVGTSIDQTDSSVLVPVPVGAQSIREIHAPVEHPSRSLPGSISSGRPTSPPPPPPKQLHPSSKTKKPLKKNSKQLWITSVIGWIINTIIGLIKSQVFLPLFLGLACTIPVIFISIAGYHQLSNFVHYFSGSLDSFANLPQIPVALYSTATATYCRFIGLGCGTSHLFPSRQATVGKVAQQLRQQAGTASDIFQSVIDLSDVNSLGLHQTEIWELAMTVRRGTHLEDREMLAAELEDLGDLTRDLKDGLIGINSQGINAFSWIAHEFARIEAHLQSLAPPPPSTPSESYSIDPVPISAKSQMILQTRLTALLNNLIRSLSSLQASIESTLPQADRASRLGGKLQDRFLTEELALSAEKASEPVWAGAVATARALALGKSNEGDGSFKQFRRDVIKNDLKLTKESIGKLQQLRGGMEDLRSELIRYRDNVGWFRAGVIGWFAGAPTSDLEDGSANGEEDEPILDIFVEMSGLSQIINQFSRSVADAKARNRRQTVGIIHSDGQPRMISD